MAIYKFCPVSSNKHEYLLVVSQTIKPCILDDKSHQTPDDEICKFLFYCKAFTVEKKDEH